MTLNEPQCFLRLGHQLGEHAPGLKLGWNDVLTATLHALLAHGRAVAAIRQHAKKPPTVGWATVGWAKVGIVRYPTNNEPRYEKAAKAAMFGTTEKDLWNNTWFSDPVFLGHYREDDLRIFGDDLPDFPDSDFDVIRQPLDFYGANIYNGAPIGTPQDPATPAA